MEVGWSPSGALLLESFLGLELGHLRMFSLLGAPALKLAGPPRVLPDYDLGSPQILLGSP